MRGMKLSLKEDIVSLTEFSRNTRSHSRSLAKSQTPRVLTHNGKAAMVVMSVPVFEELSHAAEEYRQDMRLRTALDEYAKGNRGKPAQQVFKRVRSKAAKRQAK